MLNQLKQLNPSLNFFDIFDKSFLQYGRIITEYDFGAALEIMKSKSIPPKAMFIFHQMTI